MSTRQLTDLRAAQRTFEGAYTRTALGQFSFSLVILRIFTAEFYAIGALFALYAAGIISISFYRRHQATEAIVSSAAPDLGPQSAMSATTSTAKFRTSGDVVLLLTGLTTCAHLGLLWLVLGLDT